MILSANGCSVPQAGKQRAYQSMENPNYAGDPDNNGQPVETAEPTFDVTANPVRFLSDFIVCFLTLCKIREELLILMWVVF